MGEVIFPAEFGGTQQQISRFWEQVRNRMLAEHPDLTEKHLPILEDSDPYGRLFGATALRAIMDAIDARNKAIIAHKAFEQFENDHRKMA